MNLTQEKDNNIIGVKREKLEKLVEHSEIWWSTGHAGRSFLSYIKRFITKLLGIKTFENMSFYDQILNEAHHISYGRPWITGISQIEYLKKQGLKEDDNVLDFGCGSGRLGIHLIRYLNKSKYFGVDSHLPSLFAFFHYELQINELFNKKPNIMHSHNFEFDKFNQKFDWIIDFFVSKHLTKKQQDIVAQKVHENISDEGFYLLSPKIEYLQSNLESKGFIIVKEDRQIFENKFHNIQNDWVVMKKVTEKK